MLFMSHRVGRGLRPLDRLVVEPRQAMGRTLDVAALLIRVPLAARRPVGRARPKDLIEQPHGFPFAVQNA
jgi:hypothetical protein